VRLAGKLTRWKLDVHSETEYDKRQRESRRSLRRVEGLGDIRAELLLADGYKSAAELAGSTPEEISEVLDVTPEVALSYIQSAAAASESERVERMVLNIATAVTEAAVALRPPEATETTEAEPAPAAAEVEG